MHMSYFYHFFFWIMRKHEEDTNAVSSMKDFSLVLERVSIGHGAHLSCYGITH